MTRRQTLACLVAVIGLLAGLFISLVPTSPNFTDGTNLSGASAFSCPADLSDPPAVVLLTAKAEPACPQWVAATDSVDEGVFVAAAALLVALALLTLRSRRIDELVADLIDNLHFRNRGRQVDRLLNGGAVSAMVLVVSALIGVLFVVGTSA